jgi:hypothetical protein
MQKRKSLATRLVDWEPLRRCDLDECQGACCLHGAWVDEAEMGDIYKNAQKIIPHINLENSDPRDWFDGRLAPDQHALTGKVGHTTVLPAPDHYGGTACIFLRKDYKCALQVASEGQDLHPWRFKPFYCILHPLDLDEDGLITLDQTEAMLKEPTSCLRPAEQPRPLKEIFAPELKYLIGKRGT